MKSELWAKGKRRKKVEKEKEERIQRKKKENETQKIRKKNEEPLPDLGFCVFLCFKNLRWYGINTKIEVL